MKELIKVDQKEIGADVVSAVSARELHAFLEIKTEFKDWASRRIKEYGFIEGRDFCSFLSESSGGRPSKEYAITLDMAKELAMVEKTDKGREARKYFIECEKKLKQGSLPATTGQMLVQMAQAYEALERKQLEQEDRIKRVESKQQAFEEGFSYFSVLGYGVHKGITFDLGTAQQIGKQAATLSRDKELPIDRVKDPRFGYVNAYHESVLDEIVAHMI